MEIQYKSGHIFPADTEVGLFSVYLKLALEKSHADDKISSYIIIFFEDKR